MITIREKDILFISVNVILFFSYIAYWFMREAVMIGVIAMTSPEPNVQEGMIYLLYSFSGIAISIAAMITVIIDFWWLYRSIRQFQQGYWKENL